MYLPKIIAVSEEIVERDHSVDWFPDHVYPHNFCSRRGGLHTLGESEVGKMSVIDGRKPFHPTAHVGHQPVSILKQAVVYLLNYNWYCDYIQVQRCYSG